MAKTTALAAKTYDIDKPQQMGQMAVILKAHIIKNNLYAPIAGKNYVMVEGWMFAGGLLGLHARIVKVESIGKDKWMAQAEIVNSKDQVVTTGFALCSKEESKKKSFDEYAILSMAQTRAIGKAYRNLIGWVMKLSGYESTPAEEMKGEPTPATAPSTSSTDEDDAAYLGFIQYLNDNGVPNGKETAFVEAKLGRKIAWKTLTKKDIVLLKTQLMSKLVKK